MLNFDDDNNELAAYHPGDNYVDVFATDIYEGKFSVDHYQALQKLAKGKPIAIGEVGEIIPAERLQQQFPDFVWFMGWRNLVFRDLAEKEEGNTREELVNLYDHPYTLNAEDLPNFGDSTPSNVRK